MTGQGSGGAAASPRGRRAAPGPAAAPTRRARRGALPEEQAPQLAHVNAILGRLARGGVRVSARVNALETGSAVLRADDYIVAETGSLGKILLLIEAAVILEASGGPGPLLRRERGDAAAGAGLWQDLATHTLPLADVAALVAAHNDHLASNVLLRHVGLEALSSRALGLGLRHTRLIDGVAARRDLPGRAGLSRSTMTELAELFWRLERGEVVSAAVSRRVAGWLARGADPGMIAGAAGIDPLSHAGPVHGIEAYALVTRERGLRAEAGVLRGPAGGLSYSVRAAFDEEGPAAGFAVQDGLRAVGVDLLEYVL